MESTKGNLQPLYAGENAAHHRPEKRASGRQLKSISDTEGPAKAPAVRRIEQHLSVIAPKKKKHDDAVDPQSESLLLPSGEKATSYGVFIGFALCVLLPAMIGAVYYLFIASNQYVAEFRFTVKDAASNASPTANSLLALAGGSAIGVNYDNYIVADFLTSREAVEELQRRIKVQSLFARPEVDWASRFDETEPMEKFVPYWQKMVTAEYDPITGIASARVRAFSAHDALLIANSLVKLSEELVNRMSDRARLDAVRFAEGEVTRAEERLKAVRARVTEYRTRVGVIDPNSSVVASNSTLIQTLRGSLAQLETQLATLTRQNLQANSPLVVTLQNQIGSTKEQLQNIEATVGQNRDGQALSKVVGDYEQLDLERQFAQNMVNSTMQTLEQARANATSQHLYITPFVRPSLPQSATHPLRMISILKIGAIAFAFWVMGLLLVRSISERFA